VRIAIVGIRSMLGSRLGLQLQKSSHSIVTAGRSPEDDIHLDLTKPYKPNSGLGQFDALVHCAASFEKEGLEGATRNELANAMGALQVGQLARDAHCGHVILISSISALPENVGLSSYGLSKRHGQECLEWACNREGITFTALQPSQLYDECGIARKHQPLLYHIVDCARAGRDFPLYGNQDPLRNYLHLQDLLTVIQAVLDKRIRGCYPVVHPRSHTVSEVANTAFSVFRRGGKVVSRPEMPDIEAFFIPRSQQIFELTEVEPTIELRRGITWIAESAACSGPLQSAVAP